MLLECNEVNTGLTLAILEPNAKIIFLKGEEVTSFHFVYQGIF